MPHDSVNALAQSGDGYLWIGTSGGLARFDGFEFSVFNRENTPALREESVYSLWSASDGTLWIGTEGGGLVRYRSGSFQRFSGEEGLSNGFIRAVYEDSQSRTWVGTDRGLFRFEEDRLRRVDNRDGIPPISVHAIVEDRQGRLWVGGSGLVVFSDGRAVAYRSNRSLADDAVRDIAESSDGSIWVATVAGLYRAPGANPADIFPSEPVLAQGAVFLLNSKSGDLWAGTHNLGLLRYRGGEATAYRAPALPDNHVLALLEDSESNIWVGTQNGLLRMSRSVVSTLSSGAPEAPESIVTIYADRDGVVWMASLSGRLYRFEGSIPVPAALPAGAPERGIRTVFRDSGGALWIGTNGEGAARVAAAGVARYGVEEGLVNGFVRAFCESRDGSIWIGTDSGVSRWRRGAFQNFHTAQGLAYGSVRALYEDRAGDLWIATDRGVSRFHDEAMFPDPRLSILGDEKVWAIHEDPDGDLWFGTRGAGLFLLQGEKLTAFTTKHGFASNNIHNILADRDGNLWMSSSSGVFSANYQDLKRAVTDPEHRPSISLYGTSEGMETNQTNGGVQPAGAILANGEIWFPSTRGAARITPGHHASAGLPPVLIERVVADGREMDLAETIQTGPGNGRIEIHYTAIRLRSSDRIRFRYILTGFDEHWTEASGRRIAYYTNVPPGSYRFRVAAYETDDPHGSAEAALGLVLRPRFYQTAWFAALCIMAVAFAGLAGYRVHVRGIHARFEAVLAERNRLAREMHDTLIQGCVGISTVLDAAVSLQKTAPSRSKELLQLAQSQVRRSVDEARRAVWNLRHEADRGGGLVAALKRLAQQVSLASGVRIDCETKGDPVPLEAGVEHDLVMIAKEAMLNAVHHGRPQAVSLTSLFERDRLLVRIADDGCGFEPSLDDSDAAEHYGVTGMSEHAKQIGGTFTLESAPGKGAQVSVAVPIEPRGRG